MLRQNKHVIFASGHDHSLQYFMQNQNHYIISGAGSKLDFSKAGGDARMVRSAMGYSVVYFYKNGSAWLDFYTVDKSHPQGELIYRKKIIPQKEGTKPIENNYPAGKDLDKSISMPPMPTLEQKE